MYKPLIAIALIGTSLTACAPIFNGELQATSYQERHPISVDAQTASLKIDYTNQDWALSNVDRSRLRAFTSAYLAKGYGPITVSMPSGSEETRAGVRMAADVRNALHDNGIGWSNIHGATVRTGGGDGKAFVLVSFTEYVASSSPCGAWQVDYSKSFSNLAPPNFGCATQHNLAAMVADPHDLIGPGEMTPADAARRGIVLEKYRSGETTSTQEDDQAQGAVSNVDGG